MRGLPEIVAHRGGAGEAPENSLAAFRRVRGVGVEQVEFDVRMTADGAAVVLHDATLDRTTTGAGPVGAHTLAALRPVRLRENGEAVPTLEAVLDVLAESALRLVLEIKTAPGAVPYPGLEAICLAALDRRGLVGRATIISFSWDVLEACRSLSAAVGLGAAAGWPPGSPPGVVGAACARLARIGGRRIGVFKDHDDPEGLAAARAMGVEIGVWPVDEADEIAFWLRQPVDSLTTDNPTRAAALRAALAAAVSRPRLTQRRT
jgi:glycerophosphoryl diester phosphodiesterase